MHYDITLKEMRQRWHGSFRDYAIGFVLSLILTVASFLLVTLEVFSPRLLMFTITALALIQALCQIIFFLHIRTTGKHHWEVGFFALMVVVLLIIALGSLWIMDDLNTRTMSYMSDSGHHD